MKKIHLMLLACIMLASCGNDEKKTSNDDEVEQPTAPTAVVGNWKLLGYGYDDSTSSTQAELSLDGDTSDTYNTYHLTFLSDSTWSGYGTSCFMAGNITRDGEGYRLVYEGGDKCLCTGCFEQYVDEIHFSEPDTEGKLRLYYDADNYYLALSLDTASVSDIFHHWKIMSQIHDGQQMETEPDFAITITSDCRLGTDNYTGATVTFDEDKGMSVQMGRNMYYELTSPTRQFYNRLDSARRYEIDRHGNLKIYFSDSGYIYLVPNSYLK